MYITLEDYRSYITSELLDMILQHPDDDNTDIIGDASKFAEGTIATFAGSLYDTAGEFAKTADDRNYLVLMWAIHIAVYIIHQRIADDQVPEKVIKNYDDTIADLHKVATEDLPLNLPPAPGDSTDDPLDGGLRRMGSNTPRSHGL